MEIGTEFEVRKDKTRKGRIDGEYDIDDIKTSTSSLFSDIEVSQLVRPPEEKVMNISSSSGAVFSSTLNSVILADRVIAREVEREFLDSIVMREELFDKIV